MRLLNLFSARLRGLFRREAVVQDIDEEMRFYLEMETAANVRRKRGSTPISIPDRQTRNDRWT